MTSPSLRLPWLALAGLVLLAAAPAPAAAPKEKVLIDFADVRRDPDGTVFRDYEYAYEDWGDGRVIDLPQRGALVQAPSGRGGLGENRTMVRFGKTPAVDVVFLLGNANRATSLTFALTDRDGTEHQWSIPLGGRPPGQAFRHRIEMAQGAQELKPGSQPGLNLNKIHSWQVRGDWTDANVEVLLMKVIGLP